MDRIVDLIRRKRDNEELGHDEINRLVNGFTRQEISDTQMGAFLMAGVCNEFTDDEAVALTEAMLLCGDKITYPEGMTKVRVDCYSSGGVGDKIPLIAAPITAACGVAVPMIVECGTAHFGGTLDKLQSIPGFRTELGISDFGDLVSEFGLAFSEQSNEIAPADKRLNALRAETATVESLALIAASAMSKKLAEGLNGLVVDLKVGQGSLITGRGDARRLAQLMIKIGRKMDVTVQVLLTAMEQPLGFTVGNALEIMEVSQTLQGLGPQDLTELSVELAARMIYMSDSSISIDSAREQANSVIEDGSALQMLGKVIAAQGGDANVLHQFELLPNATGEQVITSPRDGFVSKINADDIGRAVMLLGAGHENQDSKVDPAVGIVLQSKVEDSVVAGTGLCALYYTDETNLDEAVQLVEDAFRISREKPEPRDLVLDLIQG